MSLKTNFQLFLLFFLCSGFCLNAQTKSPKRGVSFDAKNMKQADIPALAPGMSWFYDWANAPAAVAVSASDEQGIEYCPMAWNAGWNETTIRNYVKSHPNCKYILAYNEPNFKDQANLTPAQAAANWPKLRALANELGLKIISPACNYSSWTEWSSPKKWLDAFFELVPIEQVDGIALHCYMGWSSSLISYIKEYIGYYNKPIWLTEFCAWDDRSGTPDDAMKKIQKEYMIDTFDYLETEPMVARYAWFIAKTLDNNSKPAFPWMQLLDGNSRTLTELGKIFNNMSSYDEDYYHATETRIEAEHYVRMKGIHMEETTDENGTLDVYDYNVDDYLEYNVDVPEDGRYSFFFRYTSGQDPIVRIESSVSGTTDDHLYYSGGQDSWATRRISIPLKKGKQILRITLLSGAMRFNWFAISTDPSFLQETDPIENIVGTNLAFEKPAFASSEQNHYQLGLLRASNAVDGNTTTRWATEWEIAPVDTENWFMVDLESNDAVVNKIIIRWEAAYATAYEIFGSNDNENWEPIYSTTTGKGGVEEIPVGIETRYIKWHGIKKATQYGYSFYEFEVWGAIKTGISEVEPNGFSAYPNPVVNILSLSELCDIVLRTLNGDKLLEMKNVQSVDLSSYPTGIYILNVKTKQGYSYTKKIIKAKNI